MGLKATNALGPVKDFDQKIIKYNQIQQFKEKMSI